MFPYLSQYSGQHHTLESLVCKHTTIPPYLLWNCSRCQQFKRKNPNSGPFFALFWPIFCEVLLNFRTLGPWPELIPYCQSSCRTLYCFLGAIAGDCQSILTDETDREEGVVHSFLESRSVLLLDRDGHQAPVFRLARSVPRSCVLG